MGIIIDLIQFVLICGVGFLWFSLAGKVSDPQKDKMTVMELEKIAKKMKSEFETVRRDLESTVGRAEKLETRVYLLETTGGGGDDEDDF